MIFRHGMMGLFPSMLLASLASLEAERPEGAAPPEEPRDGGRDPRTADGPSLSAKDREAIEKAQAKRARRAARRLAELERQEASKRKAGGGP